MKTIFLFINCHFEQGQQSKYIENQWQRAAKPSTWEGKVGNFYFFYKFSQSDKFFFLVGKKKAKFSFKSQFFS